MDAHALLSAQGWRGKGHSLHATDDSIGLAKPLLLNRKDNTKGLGTKAHFTSDTWWMNAFDEQLQGLDTSKKGQVTQTLTQGRLNQIEKVSGGKWMLYASFVRGGFLEGTIQEHERRAKEEEEGSGASTPESEETATSSESEAEAEVRSKKNKEKKERGETKEERRARRVAKKARKAAREARRQARTAKKASKVASKDRKESKEEKRARREAKKAKREARKAKKGESG
ncbi:DNA-directed RNA polymerase II subunit Rpb1 [Colletotrichum tofieldiae]|nr:DNA-directed RNA polymerase II subunit Rpb1 [Colletotrichum tofieldiae]GKT74591.1 DNA-directed RNA polymerase II subunit Rpb1 [Colletotrichum tofieldiae]